MGEERDAPPRWRESFGREVATIVALKLAALALLWWLFFSPSHRIAVDGEAASRRLGFAATTAQAADVQDPHARTARAAGGRRP